MSRHIAVDLGAESGRIMLGVLENQKLHLEEIHRFANGATEYENTLRWDIYKIWNEILEGVQKACSGNSKIDSIGVNTWGVDYVLLDENNELIGLPYHYRDTRTDDIADEMYANFTSEELYKITGIQTMTLNTVFQVFSFLKQHPDEFKKVHRLLYMPDYISYLLTGKMYNEFTIASTSQMIDMRTLKYSDKILNKLGIPQSIFPEMIMPGNAVGHLHSELASHMRIDSVPVIAVASHDTASAVVGTPADMTSGWAYLSSGTWSLMGVESEHVIINEKSTELQLTNEGGIEGRIRLLKNIMGLWSVQECKRDWAKQGHDYSYSRITEMAAAAQPFAAFMNVEDKTFFAPGNMAQRIKDYLVEKGQPADFDHGQIIRIILEGLACRYCDVISSIEEITGNAIDVLHIVGGGSKNTLLNQLTADALDKQVIAGPVEATVCGNLLVQAMAQKQVASLQEIRNIIANSFEFITYHPRSHKQWEAVGPKFQKLLN